MKHTASIISEFMAMLFMIPLTCALSAIGMLACEIFPLERGTHYLHYYEDDYPDEN
jgi:hypothetical protein